MNLDALLANVGPTDIRLIAIVLFAVAAIFTSAKPTDGAMERSTYAAVLIGFCTGLYILVETLNLLGRVERSSKEAGATPALPFHVVLVATVMVGAGFVVACGAFLASRHTSPLVSAVAVQGGFGLFAATVNTLAWTMTESGRYEPIADALAIAWEFSRYLVFITGGFSLVLVGIVGSLSAYRTAKTEKGAPQHQLVH